MLDEWSSRADRHTRDTARELIAGAIGADPYERIEEMRMAGKRWAAAAGVAYQLEHNRHAVLATLKSEYEVALTKAEESVSEAKLERLARADDEYKKHIDRTAEATQNLRLAESEYWAIRSELEWDRAALAHLNAMSRLEEPS